MDITNNISNLLKFNECVVIPDVGAFITNYVPAGFNASTQKFTPPTKEVFFNSKIRKNDGLLINHLVEAENVSYTKAQHAIVSFSNQLYQRLNNYETIDFADLGSLKFDSSGNIIFEKAQHNLSLDAYGLTSYHFLGAEGGNYKHLVSRPAVIALNSRKNMVRIAASVALVLALSFFPVSNKMKEMQQSGLNPLDFFTSTEQPVASPAKNEMPQNEIMVTKPYILVGGVFAYESNANHQAELIASRGFQPEIVTLDNGNFRVILNTYSVKEEAVKAKRQYLSKFPNSGVWIGEK